MLDRPRSLVLIAVLFPAVTVVRFSQESVSDAWSLLYVLPIAIAALEFGFAGGMAAATAALGLVFAWAHIEDVDLGLAGYITRGVAFFLLGALVGNETRLRRRAEEERERLLDRLRTLSTTDGLTGLANRRAMDNELRLEMERTRRQRGALAVAMLDLDRFKDFNDRYGHPAGDALLKQAASAWNRRLRAIDTLCRYGGEEFVVLLPACPPGRASAVIERLRAATPDDQTVSAGIAEWDGEEPPESLIERADQALYAAKRAGRDRCVVAGQPLGT